jgi:membrane fusion protein, multidrug efflux system
MRPRLTPLPLRLAPVLLLGLAVGLAGCGREPGDAGPMSGGGMPPAPVTYMTVGSETVQVDADYAARLYGLREAEVRARVGGILEQRLYEEGRVVEEGAELFRIDPAPFRIALQRAEAERANARAAMNHAERDWRRVSGLFEQGAVSERERDRSLSELELAQARVALTAAGLAQARLDLEYATVRAPVAGVTGLETVTEGNLVSRGDLLTTVTQLDPIQVRFSMPSREAAARRALAADGSEELLEARLLLPDGELYDPPGRIDFTASTVDSRTGNVLVRAVFANADHRLSPGALARVRIAVERLESVYLVDAEAVAQGPSGPVLYVVDDENTAHARSVELGPQVNGRQVVLQGLSEGDRVVVKGQVALHDGAKVSAEARGERGE